MDDLDSELTRMAKLFSNAGSTFKQKQKEQKSVKKHSPEENKDRPVIKSKPHPHLLLDSPEHQQRDSTDVQKYRLLKARENGPKVA